MLYRTTAAAIALGALGWTGAAMADDPAPQPAAGPKGLEITMRIIEDPDAMAAEAITRRLELPTPNGETGERGATRPAGPVEGKGIDKATQQQGKEFGAEVSERARDQAEQAGEQREDFGRSRAKEMRPDKPEIDPPPPRR